MSGNNQSKKPFKKWRSRDSSRERSSDQDTASELFLLTFKERVKYAQWAEAMIDEAKFKFGPLGQSLHKNKYVELPLTAIGEYDVNHHIPEMAKMNRQLMLTAAQTREKSMMAMYLDRPKLYSLIKRNLSQESFDKVIQSEHFDPEEDVDDPLKLWLAVKLTHRPGSDAVDDSNRRVECLTALLNCKQTVDEKIHKFYERWKYAYNAFIDAGNNELEDRDQANLFLNAVNLAVYGEIKADIQNQVIRKEDIPGDLSAMYHYLCRFVVYKKDVKAHYGAAFATLGEEFRRERERSGRGQQVKSGRGGKQSKGNDRGSAPNKDSGDKKGGSVKNKAQTKPKRDISTVKCWECNRMGHFSSNCPDKALDEDDDGYAGSVHCGKLLLSRDKEAPVLMYDSDDGDDDTPELKMSDSESESDFDDDEPGHDYMSGLV